MQQQWLQVTVSVETRRLESYNPKHFLAILQGSPHAFHCTCLRLIDSKVKQSPLHAVEAPGGERRYSSYSLLTSDLDGGQWSASRPGRALAPPPRFLLYRRLGGPHSRSGRRGYRKNPLPLSGIEPQSGTILSESIWFRFHRL
jgi:hypothetical protein